VDVPAKNDARGALKKEIRVYDTGTRCRLVITYRDGGSGGRGKPAGVHGIEVRRAVLDPPGAFVLRYEPAFDHRL
jgi:hypothetical protein